MDTVPGLNRAYVGGTITGMIDSLPAMGSRVGVDHPMQQVAPTADGGRIEGIQVTDDGVVMWTRRGRIQWSQRLDVSQGRARVYRPWIVIVPVSLITELGATDFEGVQHGPATSAIVEYYCRRLLTNARGDHRGRQLERPGAAVCRLCFVNAVGPHIQGRKLQH